MLNINKVRDVLKSDVETVLASLSKEEFEAAMKALSSGRFSPLIPPLDSSAGKV